MKLLMAHRWLRRLVMIPAVVLLFVWILGLLPLWLIVAAFASQFAPGRWRILRLVWFFFLYLLLQVAGLTMLLGLWLGDVFGTRIGTPTSFDRHYRLMGWYLGHLVGTARRTFGLRFIDDTRPEDRGEATDRPVLVFSRHAGPGDSLLLVDAVCNHAGRRPRIVLKDFLQMDPAIDVLLNRVPTRFVPTFGRSRTGMIDAVAELASTSGPGDSLVLFPEGGNYTSDRHRQAVDQLESIGRPDLADRARQLDHLLPPKPAGALAAVTASPTADVVFVGHAGLERLSAARDVWRSMPMDNVVRVRQWRYRPDQIPPEDQREAWLYDQWEVIDFWITEASTDGAPPTEET